MSLYEQETKINPIKFLPIKTDFINRDDMVVTQFDESQQTNEFLMSKFKFFKNETENLKMLRTNASSIYKPLITKIMTYIFSKIKYYIIKKIFK